MFTCLLLFIEFLQRVCLFFKIIFYLLVFFKCMSNFLLRSTKQTRSSMQISGPHYEKHKIRENFYDRKMTNKGGPWGLRRSKNFLSKFCTLTIYSESIRDHKKHKIRENFNNDNFSTIVLKAQPPMFFIYILVV